MGTEEVGKLTCPFKWIDYQPPACSAKRKLAQPVIHQLGPYYLTHSDTYLKLSI